MSTMAQRAPGAGPVALRSRRWVAAAAAAASVMLLVAPSTSAQTPSGGDSASDLRITSAAHVTSGIDEPPGKSYTSPWIAVDPSEPTRVFSASVDVRSQRCAFHRSLDGGRTWTKTEGSPSLGAYPFCTHDNGFIPHSFLAVGRTGTLYFAHIGWDTQDGGRAENRSVFLARSNDLGDTWEVSTVRDNRGKQGDLIEKNVPTGLAVDTSTGSVDTIYVSFAASLPNPPAPAPGRPGKPMLSVSTDGGATFGDPVDVSAAFFADISNLPSDIPADRRVAANFGGGGTSLAVDAAGTLYAAWTRGAVNITPAPPTAMYMSRSEDQGQTFTVVEIQAPNVDQSGPTAPQLRWSPAGGDNGSLHVVWEGKPVTAMGDRDVLYRRSLDRGDTWEPARALNDDPPAELYGQFHPQLSVAPEGERLDLVWWDMRDGAGRLVTDVYYSYSTDSGATWSANARLTDRSVDRNIGIWKPGTGGDVRQPPGVASTADLAYVVWDDTRHATPDTETQDMYAVAVQFAPLASGGINPTAGYILAAVIGVGAVGLVLLLGTLALRSRTTPRPPPTEKAARQPVEVG